VHPPPAESGAADWIFALNGGMEVRVTTTGYLQAGFWPESGLEAPYAFRVSPFSAGMLHDHNILYKFDADILGTENTFTRLKIQLENVPARWRNQPETVTQRRLVTEYVDNEDNAALLYSMMQPEYWLILNRDAAKNKWGHERGYRINSNGLIYSMTTHADYIATRPMQWQKYHIINTLYKDSEPFGSSMFESVEAADPYLNLVDFIDGEDIAQKDIVTWVNVGLHHIPHSEDVPVVVTPGASVSVFFRPFNYFDEDPATDLLHSVYITPDGGVDHNGVEDPTCLYEPEVPEFDGYSEAHSIE